MTEGLSSDPRLRLWPLALATPLLLFVPLMLMGVSPPLAALALALVYFLGIPALDHLLGRDHRNLDRETQRILAQVPLYRALMYAAIPLYAAGMLATLWVVRYGDLPLWAVPILLFGAGITLGSVILIGHELGHAIGAKWDRRFGQMALAMVGYGHFTIEHNRGHHITVATPEDPASAPKGMGLYAFARQELWGVFIGALRLQRTYLNRKGITWWSWRNDLLVSWAMTLIWFGGIVLWLGPIILPALLVLSLFAWFALTMANYVEHYGLRRQRLDSGAMSRARVHHSWNSNFAFTNLLSFHLQRHSDHHLIATKPYQNLENKPEAPQLPSGYPGCFALALIPPLWFRVMDEKL